MRFIFREDFTGIDISGYGNERKNSPECIFHKFSVFDLTLGCAYFQIQFSKYLCNPLPKLCVEKMLLRA